MRNNALDAFRKKVDAIGNDLMNKKVSKEFAEYFERVNVIMVKWQSEKDPTAPNIADKVLVQPFLSLNRSHPQIRVAIILNDDLLLASAAFKNQENVLENLRSQSVHYAETFENFSESGKELDQLNRFSVLKPRTW